MGSKERGRGVVPTDAIRAQVERLTVKVRGAHLARAVCAGLAAFALTLALVVIGGIELRSAESIALAAGVGVVAALTWRLGQAVSPAAVARDLDRSLAYDGALLAAFEASAREHPTGIAELGAARVFRSLDRPRAEAAVMPHTVGFVALPVVAFAALALAVEARSDRAVDRSRADARAGGAVQGAQNLLAEAAAGGETMDGEAIQEALDAVQEAAEALAGEGAGEDEEERGAAMSRMGEALDELARETEDPELADALRELAMDAELQGDAPAAESEDSVGGEGQADAAPEGAADGATGGEPEGDADGEGAAAQNEGGDAGPGVEETTPTSPDPADGSPGGGPDGGPDGGGPGEGAATRPTSGAPRPVVPERYRALLRRWESRG